MNRYKNNVPKLTSAFASFDALLSILAVVIIIVQTISIQATLSNFSQNALTDQAILDKLTTISEYAVQNLAAKKEFPNSDDSIVYPNLVTSSEIEDKLSPAKQKILAKEAGLSSLSIGFDKTNDRFCIYRLVLYEDGLSKEIRQLFICGG